MAINQISMNIQNHFPSSQLKNQSKSSIDPEKQLMEHLIRHDAEIYLIPSISADFTSYSVKIPNQNSIRIHITLVPNFRKFNLDQFDFTQLKQNSEFTKIENAIIYIKNDHINFSNKRSHFRYLFSSEYSSCCLNSKQLKKGLFFEFYSKKNKLNAMTGKKWIKFTKSWFICKPPSRKKNEILHPAKFPEKMIEEYIEFFTKPGELVVDPFLGTGSTMISSYNKGRSCVGFEISEKYHSISSHRINEKLSDYSKEIKSKKQANSLKEPRFSQPSSHNEKNILEGASIYDNDSNYVFSFETIEGNLDNNSSNKEDLLYLPILGDANFLSKKWNQEISTKADFCITSPPYWNQLKKSNLRQKNRSEKGLDTKYSNNIKDIGNLDDYNEFLKAQRKIFYEINKILKKNAYIVIITNNVYANGRLYPLAFDTLRDLSDLWVPKDEKIWCQDDKALVPLGVNSAWVGNRHHQYCLIFKKEK